MRKRGKPRLKHQSKVRTIGTSWDEEWGTLPPPPHSHVPGPIGTAGFFLPRRARAWKTRLGERRRRAQPALDGLTLLHPALKALWVPVARNFLPVAGAAASPDPKKLPCRFKVPRATRSKNPAFTPPRATEAAITGIT